MRWIGLLVLVAGIGCGGHNGSAPDKLLCFNNLRQLGGMMGIERTTGKLKPVPGSGFLLQLSPKINREDQEVFVCPADPKAGDPPAGYCSYYGPDETNLEQAVAKRGRKPVVIACCTHHEDGMTVLYSSTKVSFLRWENVEGSDGGPIPVGPDSPDPRFRHLVR